MKANFADHPLFPLEFTKLLMPFFKKKVSFCSNFGSLFSFMRDNTSFLF